MAALRAVLISIVLLLTALVAVPTARIAPHLSSAVVRRACRVLLALLGIRVRVEGTPAVGLLVANHVSWLDAVLMLSARPLCFLAKREVGTWPLIASLAASQGTVFVDRQRPRCIPTVNRAMADRLAEGRSVLLFPEGTTHDGTRRGRFHTSHLACVRSLFAAAPERLRVEVQPVALAYSDPVAAWIGDDALLPHLWRVLQCPGLTCELRFGTPVGVERGYDRKVLGRALLGDIEALLSREPLAVRAAVRAAETAATLPQDAGVRRPRLRLAPIVGYAAGRSPLAAEPSVAGRDAVAKAP